MMAEDLSDDDYRALAGLRFELRRFQSFSEQAAVAAGMTPQQHQALLAIRSAEGSRMAIGELAERLLLKPHSASELVRRLAEGGLVVRRTDVKDRRSVQVELTARSERLLASLSASHRAELRRLRPLLGRLLDAF